MVFWDDRVSGMALGYLVCTWLGIGSSSQVLEVVFLAHAPRITAWRALNTHDFYKIPRFMWLFTRKLIPNVALLGWTRVTEHQWSVEGALLLDAVFPKAFLRTSARVSGVVCVRYGTSWIWRTLGQRTRSRLRACETKAHPLACAIECARREWVGKSGAQDAQCTQTTARTVDIH